MIRGFKHHCFSMTVETASYFFFQSQILENPFCKTIVRSTSATQGFVPQIFRAMGSRLRAWESAMKSARLQPAKYINNILKNETNWLVVLTILKNMKVNGKDYPIYYGKQKMFQTTNQPKEVFQDISTDKMVA